MFAFIVLISTRFILIYRTEPVRIQLHNMILELLGMIVGNILLVALCRFIIIPYISIDSPSYLFLFYISLSSLDIEYKNRFNKICSYISLISTGLIIWELDFRTHLLFEIAMSLFCDIKFFYYRCQYRHCVKCGQFW